MPVLLALGLIAALGAPPDSSLATRSLNQQLLSMELFGEDPPEIQNTDDIDRAIDRMAEAWAARTTGQRPAYRRLGVYAMAWTASRVLGAEEPWATCHVWRTHSVPTFLTDAADVARAADGDPDLLRLAFLPDLSWVQSPSVSCIPDPGTWPALVDALRSYPEVVRRGLSAGHVEAPEAVASLERVARSADVFGRVLDVIAPLNDRRLDDALAALSALAGDGTHARAVGELAPRLAEAYVADSRPRYALATLDLAARTVSQESLPRDSLRTWYLAASPESGPDRFEAATRASGGGLVPGEETVERSGAYANVATDESVDLAAFDGQWLLLDFWSVGCGPCKDAVPELNQLDATTDWLTVLSISSDVGYGTPAERVREAAEEWGMETTVLHDTEDLDLMTGLRLNAWPSYLLVAPDGRVFVEPVERRRRLKLAEVQAFVASR